MLRHSFHRSHLQAPSAALQAVATESTLQRRGAETRPEKVCTMHMNTFDMHMQHQHPQRAGPAGGQHNIYVVLSIDRPALPSTGCTSLLSLLNCMHPYTPFVVCFCDTCRAAAETVIDRFVTSNTAVAFGNGELVGLQQHCVNVCSRQPSSTCSKEHINNQLPRVWNSWKFFAAYHELCLSSQPPGCTQSCSHWLSNAAGLQAGWCACRVATNPVVCLTAGQSRNCMPGGAFDE